MKILKTKKYSQKQVNDSRFATYDELIEVGKKPTPSKKKSKRKRNEEPLHSLDMHCDGEDDGY
jgi:hypothetical protein